jgi:hypothetical protein
MGDLVSGLISGELMCPGELMLAIPAVVYFSGKVWKEAAAVVSQDKQAASGTFRAG